MGVSGSIQLQDHFVSIQNWPSSKATSILKTYTDGEYDFGIDFALIMTLTAMNVEESKAMIRSHAKNDTGVINALTFMITLTCLADSDRRNEVGRFNQVFDLFDFNRTSLITIDELAILLLCVVSSFAFVLGRTNDLPTDASMIELAGAFYEQLEKKKTDRISKDEFLGIVTDRLFKTGATSIDSLFERLISGPCALRKDADETKSKSESKKK